MAQSQRGGQAVSDEEWKKRVERAVEVSTYWFEKFHAANNRITKLEQENDALRADLLLWNEKEEKL
jgi:hypothetical protein